MRNNLKLTTFAGILILSLPLTTIACSPLQSSIALSIEHQLCASQFADMERARNYVAGGQQMMEEIGLQTNEQCMRNVATANECKVHGQLEAAKSILSGKK